MGSQRREISVPNGTLPQPDKGSIEENLSTVLVLRKWLFGRRDDKSLHGEVTRQDCFKMRSPKPLASSFVSFFVEMGKNEVFFFNKILSSFWSHETRIWLQYQNLKNRPGPPDIESHLPFCHKAVNNLKHRPEFSSPGLVNAFPSTIQVEFCLSEEVNAVAEGRYCPRVLPNIICLEIRNKYICYTLEGVLF